MPYSSSDQTEPMAPGGFALEPERQRHIHWRFCHNRRSAYWSVDSSGGTPPHTRIANMRGRAARDLYLCLRLATIGLAACRHGSADEPPTDAASAFPVIVTAGDTPTISWSGVGAVRLSVSEATGRPVSEAMGPQFRDGTSYWFIVKSYENGTSGPQGGFASPIAYGIAPSGGCDPGPCPAALPLVQGRRYLVLVQVGQAIGYAYFVP